MCPWDTGNPAQANRKQTYMMELKRGDTIQLTMIKLKTFYKINLYSMSGFVGKDKNVTEEKLSTVFLQKCVYFED